MKPTNFPTQDQKPSPRKNGLKLAVGPLFPAAFFFSWVGIDFIQENRLRETRPNRILTVLTFPPIGVPLWG